MKVEVLELNPQDILLLEENAHYMKPDTYSRLVANVAEDEELTSAPFLWWNSERNGWECLSGNHRVQASRDAGLRSIYCLVTHESLTPDKRRAIQLSHNNLLGDDDPTLLKKLYEEIESVELRAYTGYSDSQLELIKSSPLPTLAPVNLEFRTITILFLPDEVDEIERVMDEAQGLLQGEVWGARLADYAKLGEVLELISASYNVKNRAVLFKILTDCLNNHLTELADGWIDAEENARHWVPIATLTGNAYMPVESAKILQQALDQMARNKDIGKKNRWQGLEFLAANYLAGEA